MEQKSTVNIFKDYYDTPTYAPEKIQSDLNLITMIPIRHGTHKKCHPDQFARVHWKAKISKTNHMVQNTVLASGLNNPIEFKIGEHQLTYCLDLAVPQMRPGDKFKVKCPSSFVYGDS